MGEGILYLVTSFWLGAVHAATPGHGKTIAASYIVGVRGRPVDALVLGIFVTLSHTSGIVLVAVLATLGSTWLIPQRVEAYLAVGTGILVIGIGCWMLRTQMRLLPTARPQEDSWRDRGDVTDACRRKIEVSPGAQSRDDTPGWRWARRARPELHRCSESRAAYLIATLDQD
jgi:nickel/cobalt exporter